MHSPLTRQLSYDLKKKKVALPGIMQYYTEYTNNPTQALSEIYSEFYLSVIPLDSFDKPQYKYASTHYSRS